MSDLGDDRPVAEGDRLGVDRGAGGELDQGEVGGRDGDRLRTAYPRGSSPTVRQPRAGRASAIASPRMRLTRESASTRRAPEPLQHARRAGQVLGHPAQPHRRVERHRHGAGQERRRRRRRRTRCRWGRRGRRGPRARCRGSAARRRRPAARSRTSPQPNQVARSGRSTKRSPPSGWRPAAVEPVVDRLQLAKLPPHDRAPGRPPSRSRPRPVRPGGRGNGSPPPRPGSAGGRSRAAGPRPAASRAVSGPSQPRWSRATSAIAGKDRLVAHRPPRHQAGPAREGGARSRTCAPAPPPRRGCAPGAAGRCQAEDERRDPRRVDQRQREDLQ